MALRHDIESLRAEVEALRRETAAVRAPADAAPAPAPPPATDEGDIASVMQKLLSQFGETVETVGSEIEDHPQASVAAAFGLGIVVGMLIAR
ncbi:hypothetical protein E8L99_01480 [Phreatobacter aquaticus]|uniref:DUF883 family protein n=1 Tax=Phreatobacter aquaticus TaxID=2570229 RepID=A0A4D7QG02_9HYPH|nr:DUF883 C-terminal domain-containing protein [Phreatobacter aquaticus]QCK84553.1 hypothetical protein E8L99_01480 [Phreatobacter aquaticus]